MSFNDNTRNMSGNTKEGRSGAGYGAKGPTLGKGLACEPCRNRKVVSTLYPIHVTEPTNESKRCSDVMGFPRAPHVPELTSNVIMFQESGLHSHLLHWRLGSKIWKTNSRP